MASNSATLEQELEALHPPLGKESLKVTHGKLGMWTFLVMDAMTFAGFLAGYARLRWGVGSAVEGVFVKPQQWPNPYDTFGQVGIQMTALNTFILVCSSVTMVHALAEALRGNMKRSQNWLLATVIGGLIFLGIQGFEWTHLLLDVFPALASDQAATVTNRNFAATFLSLTGFHGCHVAVGVLYNLIIYMMIRNGRITQKNASLVEIAGLYWHFVDLVWILVFTFVYLI